MSGAILIAPMVTRRIVPRAASQSAGSAEAAVPTVSTGRGGKHA